MNKARIVFLLSCLFLGSANASIINADNSSFLDTNTGLEWIDFGINDRYTYDFVSNQLGAGQRYSGWRLATEDEVVDLYFSYFYFQAEQQQSYLSGGNLNYISWAYNRNSGLGSVRSVFDDSFDHMGNNEKTTESGQHRRFGSVGMFLDDEGDMSAISLTNEVISGQHTDSARLHKLGSFEYFSTFSDAEYSTLLVRGEASAQVSEPASLGILSIALLGFGCLRRQA